MKCKHCRHEIEEDYQTIISKKLEKEFRIYKWEDKLLKDFKIPKGFNFAEHSDFIYLYDNDLIELEKYPIVYFMRNLSKKNIKNDWELSRVCLYGLGGLGSDGGDLEGSGGDGRVVVSRELKARIEG